MTAFIRFSSGSLPVSPWRNGGGETREIVSWPAGQPDFDWRASIATIAADGPFSRFVGIDRSITLLSGDGVLLQSEEGINHALSQIGEPFSFKGETPISAELLGGVTTDFNIMTRREKCSATVSTQRTDFNLNAQKKNAGLLYVIRGSWQISSSMQLAAQEGVYWTFDGNPPATEVVHALVPDALLLVVEIR